MDDEPPKHDEDDSPGAHTKAANRDGPLARFLSEAVHLQVWLQPTSKRGIHLLDAESNQAEASKYHDPIAEGPPERFSGNLSFAGFRGGYTTIDAYCLKPEQSVQKASAYVACT